MPGKELGKNEFAIWLCRTNGPTPGECLQVGMGILRGLDMEKLADDESPPFWAFIGLLEWVHACIPAQEAVALILRDLQSLYLMSPSSLQALLKRIIQKRPEFLLASSKVNLSV